MRWIPWLASLLLAVGLLAQPTVAPKVDTDTHWANIGAARQQILAPLAPDWDTYTALTRQHYVALADSYPKLKPEARARIDSRLKHWASMTREERVLARTNYRKVQQLPPEKRAVVKEQLKQAHAKKLAAKSVPATTAANTGPIPATAPLPASAASPTAPLATPATAPAVTPAAPVLPAATPAKPAP